jgi:hypothetical protein
LFTGTLSTANTGLYRANARLSQAAANSAVIPANTQGYNHAGDLTFDAKNVTNDATQGQPRVLLPLECYYPNKNPSNTCGTGGIAVADPVSLKASYYVNLAGVPKAMWAEITPDNLGTTFTVVSYDMGADFISPTGSATTEITVTRSSSNNEPEGLAVTTPVLGSYPLGGALHWQMLPSIPFYCRILNYTP